MSTSTARRATDSSRSPRVRAHRTELCEHADTPLKSDVLPPVFTLALPECYRGFTSAHPHQPSSPVEIANGFSTASRSTSINYMCVHRRPVMFGCLCYHELCTPELPCGLAKVDLSDGLFKLAQSDSHSSRKQSELACRLQRSGFHTLTPCPGVRPTRTRLNNSTDVKRRCGVQDGTRSV